MANVKVKVATQAIKTILYAYSFLMMGKHRLQVKPEYRGVQNRLLECSLYGKPYCELAPADSDVLRIMMMEAVTHLKSFRNPRFYTAINELNDYLKAV